MTHADTIQKFQANIKRTTPYLAENETRGVKTKVMVRTGKGGKDKKEIEIFLLPEGIPNRRRRQAELNNSINYKRRRLVFWAEQIDLRKSVLSQEDAMEELLAETNTAISALNEAEAALPRLTDEAQIKIEKKSIEALTKKADEMKEKRDKAEKLLAETRAKLR